MANIWDKDIDKTVDWGGDASTGGLPVSGEKVQKFIKDTLEVKAGEFYLDKSLNRYLVFADESDRDIYLADPEHHRDLLKAEIQLEPMYYMTIDPITPSYTPVFLGDKGNYIRYTFETIAKSGTTFNENVDATYTIQCGNSTIVVNESYRASEEVAFNIDNYLLEGSNNITVNVEGQLTGVSTKAQWTFEVVNLSISDTFDLTNVYHNDDNLTVSYQVTGSSLKRMEWWIDGVKNSDDYIGPAESGTKDIYLSGYGAGRHNLQYRAYVEVSNGAIFYSNTLSRDFVIDDQTLTDTVILTKFVIPASEGIIDAFTEPIPLHGPVQYEEYNIGYAVYSKTGLTLPPMTITLGNTSTSYSVKSGYSYTYSIRSLEAQTTSLTFDIDNQDLVFNAYIAESLYDLEKVQGAVFEFNGSDRSNSSDNRNTWIYGNYTGTLSGFSWIESSGWNNGRLVIPAGASFVTDYKPFVNESKQTGFTFEAEFRTSRVTDENTPVIDLTVDGKGLLITASEIKFSSRGNTTVSTKYKPEEDLRVSIVVNPVEGATYERLLFIYIDGVLTGAVQYEAADTFIFNKALQIIGSADVTVYLKQILCYRKALSSDEILNNFILYRDSVADLVDAYDRNNIYEENGIRISDSKLAARTPIIIVTGDVNKLQNFTKDDKKTYVRMDKIEVINLQDPTKNMTLINPSMRCQGTSSMEYPRKNFRFYTQADSKDKTVPAYVTKMYDWEGKELTGDDRVYAFKDGARPVECWCLKADYAESSSTHNTGVARLWNDKMKNARIAPEKIDNRFYLKSLFPNSDTPCRTIAQHLAEANSDFNYDVRTTVDGYPISLFFHERESDPLTFIGRYNWNNDKSTESVFGFCDVPGFDEDYSDTMQCWEVINGDYDINQFKDLSLWNDPNKGWSDNFEARYPDDSGEASEAARAVVGGPLWTVSNWINSTKGASKVQDGHMVVDDPDLMTKFSGEKWGYLDVYKIAAYYIYLMRFGAVDQTVKNAMFTTEDGVHWYYINYDNDTINGVRNDGTLKFGYTIDRQSHDPDAPSAYCYAGHDSVLWNNLEADEEFMNIVRLVDNALYGAGLTYANTINMFNEQQSAQWAERTHNSDYKYKYIDGISRLQLPKLQGPRKSHRQWWLSNRFSIYDAKYGTDSYIANRLAIKPAGTATPTASEYVTVTPAVNGQIFGFGYETPEELGVVGYKDVPITFNMSQDYYIGTTIKFYNAVNFKAVDLSRISKHVNEISFSQINTDAFDSSIRTFILGTPDSEVNTSMNTLPDLGKMKYLETFQMNKYNGIISLDLSANEYLQTINLNSCDNLTLVTMPVAAPVTTVNYPAHMNTIELHDLVNLSTLTVQGGGQDLETIIINNCPSITNDPTFILNWIDNIPEGSVGDCSLTMDTIAWDDMQNEDLKKVAQFAKDAKNCELRGYVVLPGGISDEADIQFYMEAFGPNVFDHNSVFHIISAPQVYLVPMDGKDVILEGESQQYRAVVVGSDVTPTIIYQIESGSRTGCSFSNTGLFTSTELTGSTGSEDFVLKATAIVGSDMYIGRANLQVKKRVYPIGDQVIITGSNEIHIGETNTYNVGYTVSGIDGDMYAVWSLTSSPQTDAATITNHDAESCNVYLQYDPQMPAVSWTLTLNLYRTINNALLVTKTAIFGYQDDTVAISRAVNPYAMDVMVQAGLLHPEAPFYDTNDKMSKLSASLVAASDLQPGTSYTTSIFWQNTNFRNNCTNFDEFQWFTGVVEVGPNLFYGCQNLESIILPANIEYIKSSAFQSTKIKKLNIKKPLKEYPAGWNLNSLEEFEWCGLDSSLRGGLGFDSGSLGSNVKKIIYNIPENGTLYFPWMTTQRMFGSVSSLENKNAFIEGQGKIVFIKGDSNGYGGSSARFNLFMPTDITDITEVEFDANSLALGGSAGAEYPLPDMSDWPITKIGARAFYNSGIEHINLKQIIQLGEGSFTSCDSLNNIEIGTESEASIEIPQSCFSFCDQLNNVILSNNITSIGNGAFSNNRNLQEIIIPDSVTSISSSAFARCESLIRIKFPAGATALGNNILMYCNSIQEIDFGLCESNVNILPGGNSSVLGDIKVPTTIKVDPLNSVYYGNDNHCLIRRSNNHLIIGSDTATIPEGVVSIDGYAFNKSSITEFIMPDSLQSIGFYPFAGCNMVKVHFGANWHADATGFNEGFKNLNEMTISENNAYYHINGGCLIENGSNKLCIGTNNVTIPNDVTTIGYDSFHNRESLTSVLIPSSVTSIEDFAFYNTGITSIDVSGRQLGTSVFYGCKYLTNVNIENTTFSSSSSANNLFNGCSSLNNVTIPSTWTRIGVTCFSGCTSLTNLILSPTTTRYDSGAFRNTGITSIENLTTGITTDSSLFSDCTSLTTANWVSGTNCNHMFYGCPSLTTATVPGNTGCKYMFYDCASLTTVNFMSNATSIDEYMFYACNSLTSLTIPDSVQSIKTHGMNQNSNLERIEIGTGVQVIQSKAFELNAKLNEIVVRATTPPQGAGDMFYRSSSDLKIYVPAASLEAYKAASGWSTYASQIYAITE